MKHWIALTSLLLLPRAGFAAPPPIWDYTYPIPLTANAYEDRSPRVAANRDAVWSGFDGHDFEIYTRSLEGGPVRALTNDEFDDEFPAISGEGQVVWQGFDGADWEIFSVSIHSYPQSGVVQLTHNATDDTHPEINFDGRVVWQGFDGSDLDIFSANADGSDIRIISDPGASGTPPPDDILPQINDSGMVVWSGFYGGQWDIFAANANGTGRVNLSNSPGVDDDCPQINSSWGNQVVWQGRLSATNTEIFSAPTPGAGPVVQLTHEDRIDAFPHVSRSGRVVWMTEVAPGNWDIHAADSDGGHPEAITDWPGAEQYPVIDFNGDIAWQGFDGSDWEIYAQIDNLNYQLTDNAVDDRWPAVWTSYPIVIGCPGCDPSPAAIWQTQPVVGDPSTTEIWVESFGIQAAVGEPPADAPGVRPRFEVLGGNPARGTAFFRLELPLSADASVDVLDVRGRRIATLIDQVTLVAGERRIGWDGRNAGGGPASAGVYLVRLRSGSTEIARKILLVR